MLPVDMKEGPVRLTRRSSQSTRQSLARTYRWVKAWLIVGVVLALLLLANSIRDYLFVWRILAVQQVRQELSQQVVDFEQRLRRPAAPGQSPLDLLPEAIESASGKLLWLEVRRPDGSLLARRGNAGGGLFSSEEESTRFRNRESLYKVVPASVGEAVVEVFPVYSSGLAVLPSPTPPGAAPPTPRRSLVAVEVAAPLAVRDASVIWPIRRNLAINCSGALALLATVVFAGLGFRSYARGRRLELQLEIARQVQSELLPSRTEAWDPVRLATVYRPAELVGGDFYDVFRNGEGPIGLVMGDVSGKGVPAALLMGVIHGAVRSSAWPESTSAHERESGRLNLLLCENASGSRFASMFWCYYDPLTRLLCYVNAGHCPPFLVGDREHGREVARLDAGGPVLGILPAARYEQARCEVRPGDVLVLYSDGLIEATSLTGEEYGEDRLRELLATKGAGSADDVRDAILASATAFLGPAPPRDDVTLVVARFA
jgi:hypothetical protein